MLLVSRLQFDVIIYSSPLKKLRPEFCPTRAVDSGVRVQASRDVRPDLLVQNDLPPIYGAPDSSWLINSKSCKNKPRRPAMFSFIPKYFVILFD